MEGVVHIKREHLVSKFDVVSEYVISLYEWFVEAAMQRLHKPEAVEFPIWCSISEENMMRPIEGTVVYVLEVDPSEIIYFDGGKWDYVLNHLYIPLDAEDEAAYKKEMALRGHKDVFSFITDKGSRFYPEERKQVMDSWHRIFDIEDWNIFKVQANIWEIRPEMIVEILHFEA